MHDAALIEHQSKYDVSILKETASINRRIAQPNLSIEQLLRNSVDQVARKDQIHEGMPEDEEEVLTESMHSMPPVTGR